MKRTLDAIVIGAGVSGLTCARELRTAGLDIELAEAADGVGGRIRTDSVDGFLLDRGFQVLLTAYPEARRTLNYENLRLKKFYPGALVRFSGAWHRVADPMRRPIEGALSILNPIGSFADKLRVARLRLSGTRRYETGPEMDTLEALKGEGFSDAMIERFLRPFLGGVFLETELQTTARKFASVWKNFSSGDIAVPAEGMEQIPRQLAQSLPQHAIRLKTRVESLGEGFVRLARGETVEAKNIVIATAANEAHRLLGSKSEPPEFNSVFCLYFNARRPPLREPTLVLNGDGKGPINNLTVMSEVSPHYAPEGRSLVSVSIPSARISNPTALETEARIQLKEWFGEQTDSWRLLRSCHIQQAIPFQRTSVAAVPRIKKGLYLCGDHCGLASLDSAISSGRTAALSLLHDFRG